MTKHSNPYDIFRIVIKNVAKSIGDSITTETILTGGSFAVGNVASGTLNALNEVKDYSKQSIDALFYLQVKTFFETTELNQEEVEEFLDKNPNNIRLSLEVFKILESTVEEKQAEYLAKAFRLHIREKINKFKLNEYFHLIKQLDSYTIHQIENDLELYKVHQKNGLHGLPSVGDEKSIIQFLHQSAPREYIFQKIGFVMTKPKELNTDYSGRLMPETIYMRTGLYCDFYLDLHCD